MGVETLRVAVTGHRPGLNLPDAERVGVEIDAALALIARSDSAGNEMPVSRVVVCSLAEGADRIAARAALAAGWQLVVTLPLTPSVFESDFAPPASVAEFRLLLARARSVDTVVLPADSGRVDAYAAAGLRTLEDCNLLLAVWDGLPARGRGGTGEVVAEAMRRHIPVVHIHSLHQQPARLITEDGTVPLDAVTLSQALRRSPTLRAGAPT